MFFLTYLLSTRFVLYSVSVKMLQYWCLLVSVQYSQTLWILDGLFACRHVYQFSKVFVGEQTLSRSASSSVLCASSRVAATTASTTLPSHTCLVADRVMSPNVPASSPSESAPVVLSRVLVRSPSSSPVTCHESSLSSPADLPDIASADKVRSMQELPSEPESSATDTCGRLQDSQVKCFLNHVNQGYKNPSISSWSTVRNCFLLLTPMLVVGVWFSPVFRLSVGFSAQYVCLFVRLHNISKSDAARYQTWRTNVPRWVLAAHLFWCQRSRSRVTKHCRCGSLHSCECWPLLIWFVYLLVDCSTEST